MKTGYIILGVVVVVLVAAGVWYYMANSGSSAPTGPVAGPGQPCGGNMVNPPVCGANYKCLPRPSSTLPFGDVGGICVAVQAQGGYGY